MHKFRIMWDGNHMQKKVGWKLHPWKNPAGMSCNITKCNRIKIMTVKNQVGMTCTNAKWEWIQISLEKKNYVHLDCTYAKHCLIKLHDWKNHVGITCKIARTWLDENYTSEKIKLVWLSQMQNMTAYAASCYHPRLLSQLWSCVIDSFIWRNKGSWKKVFKILDETWTHNMNIIYPVLYPCANLTSAM